MSFFDGEYGLYTDFYEIRMAQGYFLGNKQNEQATFDYFFRSNPLTVDLQYLPDCRISLICLRNLPFAPPTCRF